MEWNQEIFLKNIDRFLVAKFAGNQTKLNEAIDSRDAVTRWRKGDRPALDILLRVTEALGCTIDDLLTDRQPPISKDDPISDWMLKELIKSMQNTIATQEKHVDTLENTITQLRKTVDAALLVIIEAGNTGDVRVLKRISEVGK
jgi:transcriptional regulator with XRE-family HTH domain